MDATAQPASDHVFAYGTLQPGCAPEEIAEIVRRFEIVGNGFVRGTLYDLGSYPGAVLDENSSNRIFGTVFRLPAGSNVLPSLDAYEGFDAQVPGRSLFVRRLHPVCLNDGATNTCWIYEYNGPNEHARVIESGIYVARR